MMSKALVTIFKQLSFIGGVNWVNLQELEQLKQTALAEKQLAPDSAQPRITVGMGTCGIKAGARHVFQAFGEELKQVGCDAVLVPVGCKGACSYEPLVEVKLPGLPTVLYGNVDPEKVKHIVRQHLMKKQPVHEWVLPA
ncbi:ferredoxin [Thermincola potens JR]|uniref:Ferredoxin n=1 Tax=Thermincola potens (strain JR) TaxID=635013 RepID=D5XBF8_THEPJ|nr:ferredoxin [Thermincola potens JR]